MANYKAVDADQLDAELTLVADSIRAKGGAADELAFPEGFMAAIEAIETGSASQENEIIMRSISGSYSNDEATSVGGYAFYKCGNLKSVRFSKAKTLEGYAFYDSGLQSVDFPLVESTGNYIFQECSSLSAVSMPAVKQLGNSAFRDCKALYKLDFPVLTQIGTTTFLNSALSVLILRANSVCSLAGTNAFTSTPVATGGGFVYVPAALVDSYKAATNWSTYAEKIRAIEDYPQYTGG